MSRNHLSECDNAKCTSDTTPHQQWPLSGAYGVVGSARSGTCLPCPPRSAAPLDSPTQHNPHPVGLRSVSTYCAVCSSSTARGRPPRFVRLSYARVLVPRLPPVLAGAAVVVRAARTGGRRRAAGHGGRHSDSQRRVVRRRPRPLRSIRARPAHFRQSHLCSGRARRTCCRAADSSPGRLRAQSSPRPRRLHALARLVLPLSACGVHGRHSSTADIPQPAPHARQHSGQQRGDGRAAHTQTAAPQRSTHSTAQHTAVEARRSASSVLSPTHSPLLRSPCVVSAAEPYERKHSPALAAAAEVLSSACECSVSLDRSLCAAVVSCRAAAAVAEEDLSELSAEEIERALAFYHIARQSAHNAQQQNSAPLQTAALHVASRPLLTRCVRACVCRVAVTRPVLK